MRNPAPPGVGMKEEGEAITGEAPLQDNELGAEAAAGDQRSLAVLLYRYRPYVYRIAYKIALNEEDALDITQNTCLRVIQKIGHYRQTGSFKAWLATLAAHEAINHLRRPSRREMAVDPDALGGIADGRRDRGREEDPRESASWRQRREMVEGAMAGLPPQQRAVFALHLAESLPPREIGARLGIPPKQASGQLRRAMARLRETLTGHKAEKI